jgi:competence protein ComEA
MEGGFREWLSGLSRREIVLVATIGALALGGGALWYVRSVPGPVSVEARGAGPEIGPTPAPVAVFVDVAGWVRRPGVYELDEGERVIDAIECAGGARPGAELTVLNLAAPLTDGQQVLVPRKLEPAPGASEGVAPDAPAGTTLVNVNTATAAELETLPGIGEVLAQAIIDFREDSGPFTSVDQLIDVSGIGEVTLEEIRELVTI